MLNAVTLPALSPSNDEISFTAYRNLRFGLTARKLGLFVSAARPSGVSAPDASSKRNA